MEIEITASVLQLFFVVIFATIFFVYLNLDKKIWKHEIDISNIEKLKEETKVFREKIYADSKDYHARLCYLEEKIKEKKNG
jgi:hypothetical protein